jgi:hypothetical protein
MDWSHSMPTIRPDEYWKISHDASPVWTAKFNSRGANANVFILDLGGFAPEDFKGKTERVQMETVAGTKDSHCSLVANCIAGDSVGLATDAYVYPLAREPTTFYLLKIMNWICSFQTELRLRNNNKVPLSILNCSLGYENEKDNTAPIYEALTKLPNAGVAVFKSAGNQSLNLDDKDVRAVLPTGTNEMEICGISGQKPPSCPTFKFWAKSELVRSRGRDQMSPRKQRDRRRYVSCSRLRVGVRCLKVRRHRTKLTRRTSQFSKPTASPSTTKAFGALESPLQQLDSPTSLFRWTRELCAPWLACFRKRPLH